MCRLKTAGPLPPRVTFIGLPTFAAKEMLNPDAGNVKAMMLKAFASESTGTMRARDIFQDRDVLFLERNDRPTLVWLACHGGA